MVLKGVGSMEVSSLISMEVCTFSMEVSSLVSMEVCSFSMEVVCVFSMQVIWMVLKGGWLYAVGTFGHRLALDLEWCGLPLPLRPLDVLRDFLFPAPDCLDLHHVLKWFLLPHLWHFLPLTGYSLGRWDVPHLPHILPLALWPWPFLCLKVLISLIVVAIATPPLNLCHWKSLTVASCCLACCSSLSKVAVSFSAICDLTHFLTLKCLVAWKNSSNQCCFFSFSDV